MTTSRYIYNSLDINMAVLRFWGEKPPPLLDILHFDAPLGWYVFEGFHSDAIAPGNKYTNKDGEVIEIPGYDEDLHNDAIEKYIKARAEANKHYAVIGMFDFGDTGKERFYWLTDKHIVEIDIIPGTKEITKLVFLPPTEEPNIYYDRSKLITIDNEKALQKIKLLGNYDSRVGRFRCRYESIIDNLVALSILDQQLTLLVIRVGSGIRYIVAPASTLSDSKARTELEDTLENMGMNTLFVVPFSDVSEDQFQLHLDFGDGSPPIDWQISRFNLLRGLCIRLGIPEEVFNGAEIGMRSAETNHGRFLTSLRKEQKYMDSDIMWIDSVLFNYQFADTDIVSWNPFEEPDEENVIAIFASKMEALDKALKIQEKAGMPLEFIMQELKLEYEIDQSLIQKFEQRQEMQQEALNQGVDKSQDKGVTNGQPEQLPNQSTQTNE